MTWAEGSRLTNWATQAPQSWILKNGIANTEEKWLKWRFKNY